MKLLIVGGYGTFGGRIVRLLENEPRLELIIAGRSLARAEAYCKGRGATEARLVPTAFDRDGDLAAQLAGMLPDIVVDASGPFQAYGEGRYRLVQACIGARIHYLDLADGSDFVAGVSAFDAAAKAAGVMVLSGVSSFPVLTAAVVRRLSAGMVRVDGIRGGIAPSPFAGVGENVIRAIASYAGRPVQMLRGGRPAEGYPFTEQMRYTIAPPGRVPLRNTLFSLVDVPDLRALQALWPETKMIWMGAGPVPELLHRALIGLAWLVRAGLVRSLSPLAPLMHWATNRLSWGEHRGGMFVEVDGADAEGRPNKRSWHLLAEGDDGPLIPSMAVAAIVRKALDGRMPPPGARAAVRDVELEDYETPFAGKTIYTGFRDDTGKGRRFIPVCSAMRGKAFRLKSAPCMRERQWRMDAPASNAAATFLAGLPPAWPASHLARPMSPSRCVSLPTGTVRPGRGLSQRTVFRAGSLPGVADRSGCFASASARSPSPWRWWRARTACRSCCAAGAFSACRCRCGFVRARPRTKPSRTAASASMSRYRTRSPG